MFGFTDVQKMFLLYLAELRTVHMAVEMPLEAGASGLPTTLAQESFPI